jgi:eukaryotic-like serine/threonine-protein kinase
MPDPQDFNSDAPTLPSPLAGDLNAATLQPNAPLEPGAPPSRWLATYEILGELGRGGMGVVYKARQANLNRVVALKVILAGEHASAETLDRFREEARAVARLQHPNIVQVYEVGEHGNLPFFSLEYCSGGSLDRKLKATPLTPEESAVLVQTLARAVQAAHANGIVHRDLKPANVLLDAAGTPKVTDFGLAKRLGELGKTASGALLGTPSYMSPEQAEGKGKQVGPAADIYALGAILYECLTGRPPFTADQPLDIILQVVADEPVPPRRLNPKIRRDLQTICLKCLEKDPRHRYSTAESLSDDLGAFLHGEMISARPPGLVGRLDRWARSRPALAATLAALAAFYLNHLMLIGLGVEGEAGDFHRFATVLTLSWAVGAIGFHWLTMRPGWLEVATYGWSALDVLMVTLLLARGDGPKSALLVAYPLLIASTALRFRVALLWFVTVLCILSYWSLVIEAAWYRPGLAVGTKNWMIFSISMLLVGIVQYQLLRRLRAATSSDANSASRLHS